jgi:hypothetical protein
MSGLRRGLPTILSETGFGCNGRLAASRDGISVYPARQICLSVRACVKNRNPHLLILVLTAASVIACRGESKFVPELAHSDLVRGADATLRNFTAEAFRKGAMLYRVAAQQGYIVQVKDETHLYDLRIEYFETNRKSKDFGKATIVTAKECKMEQGNRFMTIRGRRAGRSAARPQTQDSRTFLGRSEKLIVFERTGYRARRLGQRAHRHARHRH